MSEKSDYKIKDSGERREFGTGAVRDMATGKGRFDLLPWAVIRALAIHYQKGCEKYGDRNWEKGLPVQSFLDSASRHLAQVIDGRSDENHAVAAFWNMACAYQTILWIQEGKLPLKLYDMPNKIVLPDPYGNYHFKNWKEVEKKWGKKWNGICILCGSKDAYKNKGRNLFVDHDHKTGEVRGLLCSRCNTMIGHIELIGIEKVIEYLRKNSQKHDKKPQ
jgi:hypothetical protein